MSSSKQARRDAKDLFKLCVLNGQLDEGRVRQIVTQVIAGKPRGYMAVLKHFQRLLKLEVQRRTARVETATALAPDLQSAIQGNLTKVHGAGLAFDFVQNASLIGGMRVRVGSDVYDGSIRGRLDALRDSF
jgi:F-type H+-transporting ATPase subunit delta